VKSWSEFGDEFNLVGGDTDEKKLILACIGRMMCTGRWQGRTPEQIYNEMVGAAEAPLGGWRCRDESRP
jgi:hypothetical protein